VKSIKRHYLIFRLKSRG